jgi:hypothetical protein
LELEGGGIGEREEEEGDIVVESRVFEDGDNEEEEVAAEGRSCCCCRDPVNEVVSGDTSLVLETGDNDEAMTGLETSLVRASSANSAFSGREGVVLVGDFGRDDETTAGGIEEDEDFVMACIFVLMISKGYRAVLDTRPLILALRASTIISSLMVARCFRAE